MGYAEHETTRNPTSVIAVLEHLSGPMMGRETYLAGDNLAVLLSSDRRLSACRAEDIDPKEASDTVIAELKFRNGKYAISTDKAGPVWVNGRSVSHADLIDRDIIEFGEKGPISRFRAFRSGTHMRRDFSDICSDCWDYLRASRRDFPERVGNAVSGSMIRMATQSTWWFRIGMVISVGVILALLFQQHRINVIQEDRLLQNRIQVSRFVEVLEQSNQILHGDLESLGREVASGLAASEKRLLALELETESIERTVARASPSVVFIQAAYGYRERDTGKVMRQLLASTGKPLIGPTGTPLFSVDGDGPPVEIQYTGTAFAIADGTILVTNRHIAMPWKSDSQVNALTPEGIEPFSLRMIAYAPGSEQPIDVETVAVSEEADLALLKITAIDQILPAVEIAIRAPQQGESVVVLGYPLGLLSMSARAGKNFRSEVRDEEGTDFWSFAERLASEGLISPLSNVGVIAQQNENYLVYDAATAQGGSGGPVLNRFGEVIAVNSAVLRNFDGSNLGIPVARLKPLLRSSEIKPGYVQERSVPVEE